MMLTPLLLSGVVVVAPTPGPGVDQTSLYAAVVLASDGDIVLVKSGTYADFLPISDKSLTIVGDGPTRPSIAPVQAGTNVLIEQVPSGRTVALRGLHIDGGVYATDVSGLGASVRIGPCAGSVLLEDCYVRGEMGALQAFGPGFVGVARSQLIGASKYLYGSYAYVGVALSTTAALTTVHASTLASGAGIFGAQGTTAFGLDGGPGAVVGAGALVLSRSAITGGAGKGSHTGFYGECVWSLGECGLHVQGQQPTVLDLQSTLQPGATDPFDPQCSNPPFQAAPVTVTSGTYTALPGTAPTLEASAVRREGETLHVALESAAGEFGVLLVATSAHPLLLASTAGAVVDPAAALFALGIVPLDGKKSITATVQDLGVGVEGVALYMQAASVDPTTLDARLSNVSVAVLLDAAL